MYSVHKQGFDFLIKIANMSSDILLFEIVSPNDLCEHFQYFGWRILLR